MTTPRIGCNTIDPQLAVKRGEDYDLTITRRSLQFVKDSGFEAVEYSHALHWTDDEVRQVRAMTEEVGLVPWSLHAWVGGDLLTEEGYSQTRTILGRAAIIANGLGVGAVIHHTNGNNLAVDGSERLAAEVKVLREAWRPGMRFALECMSTLAQMEYLLAAVDELGPEVAGVNVDTGHAHLGDLQPERAVRMAGKRLITTHLQDNYGQRDDHLPPGDGLIDWEEVARALVEVNYQGCLMLELTDQPSPERRAAGVLEELPRGAAKANWLAAQLGR